MTNRTTTPTKFSSRRDIPCKRLPRQFWEYQVSLPGNGVSEKPSVDGLGGHPVGSHLGKTFGRFDTSNHPIRRLRSEISECPNVAGGGRYRLEKPTRMSPRHPRRSR